MQLRRYLQDKVICTERTGIASLKLRALRLKALTASALEKNVKLSEVDKQVKLAEVDKRNDSGN